MGQFFNFNLFEKLFLKITPGKHYLHPVTPLAPGGVARKPAFAAPHAVARQRCHAG
jgi:hypothetical protein